MFLILLKKIISNKSSEIEIVKCFKVFVFGIVSVSYLDSSHQLHRIFLN